MHEKRVATAEVLAIAVATTILGCEDWPVQNQGAGGFANFSPVPTPTTPTTPTVDGGRLEPESACWSLRAQVRNAMANVNGSYCFGVAVGMSEALVCNTGSTGRDSTCFDGSVYGYTVSWLAGRGIVYGASSTGPLGTVTSIGADEFEVYVMPMTFGSGLVASQGVCTVGGNGSSRRATFCEY